MNSYPMTFQAKATSEFGINSLWQVQSSEIQTTCSIPPEFDGPGGGLSPEDLFAQALTNCFVATFKVYAEKSKLKFSEVYAKTDLIVDLDENKKPIMKEAHMSVSISGAEQPERIRQIAQRAFQSGFILNSVKTKLNLNLEIH